VTHNNKHTILINKTKFTPYCVPPAHAPASVCLWCCVRQPRQLKASLHAMARKRQRRRPAVATAADHQGHHTNLDESVRASTSSYHHINVNGERVVIRQISTQDEGVLYTHRITVSQVCVFMIFCLFRGPAGL
jgi:hypothetical protein